MCVLRYNNLFCRFCFDSPYSATIYAYIFFPLRSYMRARECNKCTHQHQLFSHLSSNPFRFGAIDMCITSIVLRMDIDAYTSALPLSVKRFRLALWIHMTMTVVAGNGWNTLSAWWKSLVQCNCAWINLFGESIKLPLWLDNSRFCQSKSEI